MINLEDVFWGVIFVLWITCVLLLLTVPLGLILGL